MNKLNYDGTAETMAHPLRVDRRGRKIQDVLGIRPEDDWWYQAWVPFQISPTECAVPLNRMATTRTIQA